MDDYINQVTESISNIDYYSKALSDENKSVTKTIKMKEVKKFFSNLICKILSIGFFLSLPIGTMLITDVSFAAIEAGNAWGFLGFILPWAFDLMAFLPAVALIWESGMPAYYIQVDEIDPLIKSKDEANKLLLELEDASSKLEKVVVEEAVDLDVLYDRKAYLTNKINSTTNTKQLKVYKELLNIYNKKIKTLELKKQCEDTSNLVKEFNTAVYYDSISDSNLSGQCAVKELKF